MNPSPHSELTVQSPQAGFAAPTDTTQGFTVKLTVDLEPFGSDQDILEIPGVLNVRLRQHNPLDRERQNYPAFKMPGGTAPVLEATIWLYATDAAERKDMTIGIPLAILRQPEGEHEIVLNFSGVRWTMLVDGELLDNDYPVGYPRWMDQNHWKLDPERVRKAALYFPAIPSEEAQHTPSTIASIQYWTPPGHNAWVGDVTTFFYRGCYHVFYLYDRRHHASKFGKGGHYFAHLSTTDFKTWIVHEAVNPIDAQWQSVGTGTPFVFEDKFCIAYGLHTERFYPDEKTTLPVQMEYLEANGYTGAFDRRTPGVPIGATYAVSGDGISQFKNTGIYFHPCRNPSVFRHPDGKLRMFANYGSKGTWESESVNGGWRCINPDFPPGGDCTFFFHWGRFDYIIGGFTDLWSKTAEAPDSAYEDMVRKGLDFYDGSNVPAITEINGGRFLMAAWIPIHGWGGNLVLRELLQYPDGRIGARWMPEITPETDLPRMLAASVLETMAFPTGSQSFLLTFHVQAAGAVKGIGQRGRLGIAFLPETGEENACELQLDLDSLRAQFAPGSAQGFAGQEKSLREGGKPQEARNYTIENLLGVEGDFIVRVIVKGDEKLGGSLVDAEIAGQRTMISYRPDLTVTRLVFRVEGVELRRIELSPLKNQ